MGGGLDDWLRRAAAAQRVAIERRLAGLDLTAAQFAVLEIVADTGGVSSAQVARAERLTAPTISVIVGNLERLGLIRRRPHPDNARIQVLEATELGSIRRREAGERIVDWRRQLASIGVEFADVASWLRRIAAADI